MPFLNSNAIVECKFQLDADWETRIRFYELLSELWRLSTCDSDENKYYLEYFVKMHGFNLFVDAAVCILFCTGILFRLFI